MSTSPLSTDSESVGDMDHADVFAVRIVFLRKPDADIFRLALDIAQAPTRQLDVELCHNIEGRNH